MVALASDFDRAFKFVIGSEGGYSNDPHDSGSETMYGITRRDHPDLWANGTPTLEQAKERYQRDYWLRTGCDRLPAPWDLLVFDAAVNMGRFYGVQFVQRAVGVEPDGRVGPMTIAACAAAGKEEIAMALTYRAMRYAQLRGFERFGRGWLKRTYLIAMECE